MGLTRRSFIKSTVAISALAGFPTIISSSVLGRNGNTPPSDRVNIGLIGCGNRSGVAIKYKDYSKSQVVAVCDPIRERRLMRKEQFDNCNDYNDFRDLLARKDIDAVHIATSDHWHVPISLAAARAGKDMYTEKPLGKSIAEDIVARNIVDKYDRVFQYGAQQRSMVQVRMGIELVLNGHIGDVKEIYVWAPHGESGGSATPVLPVPEGYDYDLWLGPAPEAPFSYDRCLHQSGRNAIFHIYDYAIGFMAGWGAHPMDMLQWWADNAGLKTIPTHYEGSGEIGIGGLFDTLTNWDVTCTYSNNLKMRFMDDQIANTVKPHPGVEGSHGTLFVGTNGWVKVKRAGWKVSDEKLYRIGKDPGKIRLVESKDQVHNFVDSVISRKQPVDNLHSAVRSDIICHLSDICIREGKSINWDTEKETIIGDYTAARRMHRPMRAPWTL
jgi:Oxidoreductase family, C-terminal alpha/beta domain/Oxidoreductase family, NAD-binding Rossmann fold